jgi:signal transduction histidine kinase/ligand-binding sensor domain-containing protein/DNA-binding response OmpR family regulator
MEFCKYIFAFLLPQLMFSLSTKAEQARIFTPDNGLSNSHITKIYQDSQGYMWIATENGLNKFNGYSFTTFFEKADDSTSLKGNYVYFILEDSHGNFWVGTMRGLFQYDRNTNSFHPFLIKSGNPFYLERAIWVLEDKKENIWLSNPGDGIICLDAETLNPIFYNRKNSAIQDINIDCAYEDHLGNLWFGTNDNGVYVLNTNNGIIKHYTANSSMPGCLNNNKIYSICEDAHGRVLVSTLGGGINQFDHQSQTFKEVMQGRSITENQVYDVYLDKAGTIWVGTDGAGVIRYDKTGQKLPDLNLISPICDLRNSKIHQTYQDRQGNIWIAVYQKGILFIPHNAEIFKNYGFNPFEPARSIGASCVISVLEDGKGDVWIGTDGDGLYRINQSDESITHYTMKTYPKIPGNVITALFEDKDHDIWIGTYVNGMFRYNRKSNRFDLHFQSLGYSNDLSYNHVTKFVQDKEGYLWIGTNGGGINRFDIQKKAFKQYWSVDIRNSKNQLASNWVYDLLINDCNKLWIATSNGINVFDPQTETFENLSMYDQSLNANLIYCLNKDYQGNIWFGGSFGLYCITPQTKVIKHLTNQEGLPDNMITGIEEDESHYLWLSTGKGLCRYNIQTGAVLNFYVEDGIQSNEFRRGSFCKGKNNRMYFGGINGLTTFLPSQFTHRNKLLRLTFTDLLIYSKSVSIEKSNILTKVLDKSELVRLKYDQRDFTFIFAALEYEMPQRVVYYTQMENFDKEWRLVNNPNRSAAYTNLNPGNYLFKVKATLDGENFLQREIRVIIDPPFWLSFWMKIIYFLLILIVIYTIYTYFSYRMEQKKILMEKEQQKELSETKLQFFTDISHEIRTPLTLIITPIEKLMEKTNDVSTLLIYKIVQQNAIRILRLINQLIDLRAIEKGKLKLKLEKSSLEDFARQIMESFEDLAKTKNIHFELLVENKIPLVYFDKDCLDKVIFNLLSNAFKFTPFGGNIMVCIGVKEASVEIRVEDTGIGIEKEKQALIFDRFYQIQDKKTNAKAGTGIGLHLAKMMIELHCGSISIESEPDKGSKFIVALPLDEKRYSPENFGTENNGELPVLSQPSFSVPGSLIIRTNDEKFKEKTMANRKNMPLHSLLIVEDDSDILFFIQMELSGKYQIYTAINGKDGLNQALKYLPDIIISDIIMPEMDGLTLCRILKTNDKTCHIPIILLTAKTSMEQRIEGLELGADSYISKPFNLKHLETRIEKLIQLRTLLKHKFTDVPDEKEQEMKIISSDEKLFQRFNKKVKDQIGNPNLSVESVSQELGLSRVHLNRRLKSIINESPSVYIRNYRLKQAAWLLANKKIPISEVAYAVGFSSHAYFSNIFKERYGISPSEYMYVNTSPTSI